MAKGLAQQDSHDPEFVFGLACRELPGPGFLDLVISCIVVTNISTASASMVDSIALLPQGIYRRYLRPNGGDQHYLWVGRLSGKGITPGRNACR